MRFHYDKKNDSLYLRFNEKRYFESDEIKEGIIFDYDRKGKIVGIEVLNASKKFPKEFNSLFLRKRIPIVFDFKQSLSQ